MICHQCRGYQCLQCKGKGEKLPDVYGKEIPEPLPEPDESGQILIEEIKPIECKTCGGTGRVGVMHGTCKKRNEGKVPADCDCQHREPSPRPGVLLTK